MVAASTKHELEIRAFVRDEATRGLAQVQAGVEKLATTATGKAAPATAALATQQVALNKALIGVATRLAPVVLGFVSLDKALQLARTGVREFANEAARMVEAALKIEESQSALAAVFGDLADEQERFIAARAAATRRFSNDLREFQVEAGGVLQSLGLGVDEAARLANVLTTVGTDLASSLNRPDLEVFERLLGGLSGREAGVRRLGLDFSEASVKAEAFRLGLSGVNGELTDAERAVARVSLAVRGSATSFGAATAASDNLEKMQRELHAALQETRGILGDDLSKTVEAAIKSLGGMEAALVAIDVVLRLVADGAKIAVTTITGLIAIADAVASDPILQVLVNGVVPGSGLALEFIEGRVEESQKRIEERLQANKKLFEESVSLEAEVQASAKSVRGGTIRDTKIPGDIDLSGVLDLQLQLLRDRLSLYEQTARFQLELAGNEEERLKAAEQLAKIESGTFRVQVAEMQISKEQAAELVDLHDEVLAAKLASFAAAEKERAEQERMNALVEQRRAAEERISSEVEKHAASLSLMRGAIGDLSTAFVDAAKGVDGAFQQAFDNILSNIARVAVETALLRALFAGLTGSGFLSAGAFNSFFGTTFSAKGNVFDAGRVVPFAGGGVIPHPVAFPLSGGRMGVAGEAGPEAILPLKRDAGGRLGVSASSGGGGGITVQNVIVQQPGESPEELARKVVAEIQSNRVLRTYFARIGSGGVA